jgi:uncharacterized membrane protein YdjX (TVP38/TMEM64 family)
MTAENKQILKKLILSALGIGALVGALYLVMHLLGWTNMTQAELQGIIASGGAWAPALFVLISFLQVTFVPIPGAVTILAGNYLFGMGASFLYSYIGMLAGAMFAFGLGRRLGRPFVNWIAGGADKVDEWLKKLHGRENVLLFFMFLLPFFPDDILCSVSGILPLGWGGFFVMQIITRTTSVGATLLLMSGEFIPWHGWGLVVLAVIGVLAVVAFIISYRNAERINHALASLSDKIIRVFFKKKTD